ncbi:MAG: hypothetical protein GY757_09580, partial [bacterium]|nr:hypothetical protein [bacterium]
MDLKKYCLILIALMALSLTFGYGEEMKSLTIGMTIDGKWEQNEKIINSFKKEIVDLMGSEYQLKFPEDKMIVGDWTVTSSHNALEQLLEDKEVDVVLAMGILASHEVCQYKKLPKPVIAPFIVDPRMQSLPRKGKGSGVKNLNYLVSLLKIDTGVNAFRNLVDFDQLVFLSADFIRESYLKVAEHMNTFAKRSGIQIDTIWVSQNVDGAIAKLKPGIQALYLTPLNHISKAKFIKLVEAANRLKIPTFSHLGISEVQKGIFASIHKEGDYYRLARRVALNIQRIFMGEDAGTLPVEFHLEQELSINMKTARKIGLYPSWDVMTEAVLINEEETETREKLSMMQAVNMALKANLQLQSKHTEILSGRQDIRTANAKLLPQIAISAMGLKIDQDRA